MQRAKSIRLKTLVRAAAAVSTSLLLSVGPLYAGNSPAGSDVNAFSTAGTSAEAASSTETSPITTNSSADIVRDSVDQAPKKAVSAQSGTVELPAPGSNAKPSVGVCLALGGGGTRGAAHIGVLRVLNAEGIEIQSIAGTSMGAIIGGFYSAGLSPDRIAEIAHGKSLIRSFYTVPLAVRLAVAPVMAMPRLVGHKHFVGLYRGNKFAKFLSNCVPEDKRLIENLPIHYLAECADLVKAQPYEVRTGDLGRAMQASSAIPMLRRPVVYGDALLIDGGIMANCPVTAAQTLPHDLIIAVDVDGCADERPQKDFMNINIATNRTVAMLLHKIDQSELPLADVVIKPSVDRISLLSLKEVDIDLAIEAGEKAAREALPQIREKIKAIRDKKQRLAASQSSGE